MPFAKDLLLHPSPEEKKKHKCLVQSPNSYFTDVKCPGCYKIAVFSRVQTVVCVGCSTVHSAHSRKKQGLREDAPSERSNTKSTMNRERNHSNEHFGYKK